MDEGVPAIGESELNELRARLAEAEETLRAIREGGVDALLIADDAGDRLYTLNNVDAPYRALVEQMQEGAVTLTVKGDIIYSNRRFAELVAVPLEHVIGSSIDRFLVEAADRETLRVLMVGGSGKLRTHLRRDGSPVEVLISLSTLTLDGEAHRTLIVTDISTFVKVQRESRAKDEFLAMLAHELRNPLGAIGGAVEVLGFSDLREPHAIRARAVIERQVSHMARLMDDLLDVGRVVTGKIALDCRPLELGQCIRSIVTALTSGQQQEGRIAFEARTVWVNADAVRLQQIAGNLVSNALKFSPAGRPVRVSVAGEGADAVLRVADEGIGIDPELLPRVFDLFVQGEVARDRASGGLGIGLTLVRRLVELHGGTVAASSDGRGRGSTFAVRLPSVPAPAMAAASAPAEPRSPGRRVLLVDDNVDSREMYCLVLQADGHDVYQAADVATALTLFQRAKPQVALVDIGLPGTDGYELAKQIRADPHGRDVTLIALTGYGFPEDHERSRTAGFDRHLVKPAAPEDLRRELSYIR